jgi:hypothetical protein
VAVERRENLGDGGGDGALAGETHEYLGDGWLLIPVRT